MKKISNFYNWYKKSEYPVILLGIFIVFFSICLYGGRNIFFLLPLIINTTSLTATCVTAVKALRKAQLKVINSEEIIQNVINVDTRDSIEIGKIWREKPEEERLHLIEVNLHRSLSISFTITDPSRAIWLWESLGKGTEYYGVKVNAISNGSSHKDVDELEEKIEKLRIAMFKRGMEEEYFKAVEGEENATGV